MPALGRSYGGGQKGKMGAPYKIDPNTKKGKNIISVIKSMATGENPKKSTEIADYINKKFKLNITSRSINNIRNELGILKTKAGQLKSELWDEARWKGWQRDRLAHLEKPGWKKRFDNALHEEQKRWRDSIKNRNQGEQKKAVKNINAQWERRYSQRRTGPPKFKNWNSLLKYAADQARKGFRRHMADVGPRAINMLADSAESNYVYNLFLKAQIEHLATGNPLQQVSHADAARGAKGAGLSGGLNYFLEGGVENLRRGKLNLPPEDVKGWKLFQDAQKRYLGYTGQNLMPMTQNEVLGDLKLGKWGNKSVPWQTYGDESRKHMLMRARQAAYAEAQKLRPIDKAKQLAKRGLMGFGKSLRNVKSLGGLLALPPAFLASMIYPENADAIMRGTAAAFDAPGAMLGLYDPKVFSKGGQQENWQTGRGWQQSLIDPNHPGMARGYRNF